MEELDSVDLPYQGQDSKNLFIRDDKKRNFYLITVNSDKRVNLKDFRKAHETRKLTFASEKYLDEYLGLTPRSVTLLGLFNNSENNVHFYLDKGFLGNIIGVHPNDNTVTIWLKTEDLISVLTRRE